MIGIFLPEARGAFSHKVGDGKREGTGKFLLDVDHEVDMVGNHYRFKETDRGVIGREAVKLCLDGFAGGRVGDEDVLGCDLAGIGAGDVGEGRGLVFGTDGDHVDAWGAVVMVFVAAGHAGLWVSPFGMLFRRHGAFGLVRRQI